MSVVEAVLRDLEELGPKASESTLAATALKLAEGLDSPNSLTSKAMAAKELTATLRELRALAPPEQEDDRVDKIRGRRHLRVAGTSS